MRPRGRRRKHQALVESGVSAVALGVAGLVALVEELQLPQLHHELALRVVTQPHISATEHARALGIGPRRPDISASMILAKPNVQRYMAALRAEVQARGIEALVNARAAEVAEDARIIETSIASLVEVLSLLTAQARFKVADYINADGEPDWAKIRDAPPGLFKGFTMTTTTAESGQVTMRVKLMAESPQEAAKELRAHHVAVNAPPQAPPTQINVLQLLGDLPPEQARAMRARLAAGGPDSAPLVVTDAAVAEP